MAPLTAFQLTRTGALVYQHGSDLHALDGTGDHVIDSGEIDPESVHASGTTVRWTNSGMPHVRDFPAP